jgi:hypothetical protein
MPRAIVETGEHRSSGGRYDRNIAVLAGKGADRFERVEPHDGDELDLVRQGAAQQLDLLKASNVAGENARKNLVFSSVS